MIQDFRYALRALRRTPGFTLAALATLSLGIGANATVFGVVNAVLLRAYPFAETERLVALYERNVRSLESDGRMPLSPANFRDWQTEAKSFTAMAAVGNAEFTLRTDGAEPERLDGARVTWALPRVLGVAPRLGRA